MNIIKYSWTHYRQNLDFQSYSSSANEDSGFPCLIDKALGQIASCWLSNPERCFYGYLPTKKIICYMLNNKFGFHYFRPCPSIFISISIRILLSIIFSRWYIGYEFIYQNRNLMIVVFVFILYCSYIGTWNKHLSKICLFLENAWIKNFLS